MLACVLGAFWVCVFEFRIWYCSLYADTKIVLKTISNIHGFQWWTLAFSELNKMALIAMERMTSGLGGLSE